jgi:hypothetical protein
MSGQYSDDSNFTTKLTPVYLSFSQRFVVSMLAVAILGALAAAVGMTLYTDGLRRILLAYLVALAFVLSLSLGSLFFVLIQHLTRAGWAVMIRRPAEIFAMNVVTVAVLALPILWSVHSGTKSIYPWARNNVAEPSGVKPLSDHSAGERLEVHQVALSHLTNSPSQAVHDENTDDHALDSHRSTLTHDSHDPQALYVHQTFDELTESKTDWLNPTAFSVRLAVYFLAWIGLSRFYFRRSLRLDDTGDIRNTLQMERWSGPACLLFALTLTFAAFDLLMSLDPHWYSTIFGVYYFSGCAVGGFAVSLLSWLVLAGTNQLHRGVPAVHLRDLGRLLFAFVFFWGYIAFSQYMLLWYANIPETTRWWAVRGASLADGLSNSWGFVLVLLLLGHFIIPFVAIMSRHVKDHRRAMIFWTTWLLVMHYVDLYWLVMPEFRGSITFGLPEVGTMLLVCGLYAIGASYFATRTSLLPLGDPRFNASLGLSDAY